MDQRRRTAALAAGLLVTLAAAPAAGQEYGQWWWQGRLGYGLERHDSRRGEARSELERDELELSLECNGYLLHPAVGRFSLGLEGLLSEQDGDRRLDTDRWGAHAELHLFEGGDVPSRLTVRRRLYDYADLAGDDPFTLFAAPDTLTFWEARTRLRRGPLRGLAAGVRHTAYDLVADRGTDRDELQYVDWSRTAGTRFDHRLRAEHRERRLTAGRLHLEDWTLRLDERGDLPGGWRWNLDGSSLLRRTEVADGRRLDFGHHRLLNRLVGTVGGDDRLELRHRWSRFSGEGTRATDAHLLSAHYRWRPAAAWEVAPFGELGRRMVDGDGLESARLGITATWRRNGGRLDALVSGRLSHGSAERTRAGTAVRDDETGYGVVLTLEHGPPPDGPSTAAWHRTLEVELQRDELDVTAAPRPDLPDLGLPGGALGTTDRSRLRLGAGRRGGQRWADGYGEWSRDRTADGPGGDGFTAETRQVHLGTGGRRFQVAGDAGTTTVSRPPARREELDFVTASATWRPVHALDLRATWRDDRRRVALLPAIDGEHAQVEATFRLGLLELTARAYRLRQYLDDGRHRVGDGLELHLTRRLQGWLPVVTGARRRGVVR